MGSASQSKILIDPHPQISSADVKMHAIEIKRLNFDERPPWMNKN